MQKRSERNQKLQENGNSKNFGYDLQRTRIIVVRTGKEEVKRVDKRVQQGTLLETDKYKYLGIVTKYRNKSKRPYTKDEAKIK